MPSGKGYIEAVQESLGRPMTDDEQFTFLGYQVGLCYLDKSQPNFRATATAKPQQIVDDFQREYQMTITTKTARAMAANYTCEE